MTSSVVLITFRHFNCVGESAAGRNDYIHTDTTNEKKRKEKNNIGIGKVKRNICVRAQQSEYDIIALSCLRVLLLRHRRVLPSVVRKLNFDREFPYCSATARFFQINN